LRAMLGFIWQAGVQKFMDKRAQRIDSTLVFRRNKNMPGSVKRAFGTPTFSKILERTFCREPAAYFDWWDR